jgi:hypothetical protein
MGLGFGITLINYHLSYYFRVPLCIKRFITLNVKLKNLELDFLSRLGKSHLPDCTCHCFCFYVNRDFSLSPRKRFAHFQRRFCFLGFLFTFGSASLSNIIAGLILTYMRLFKIGDRVKLGCSRRCNRKIFISHPNQNH